MKIRTGDTVIICKGSGAGKTGEVLSVNKKKNKVIVTGINIRVLNKKAKSKDEKGTQEKKEMPISISNVAYADPKTKKQTRVTYDGTGRTKKRIAKKSGLVLDENNKTTGKKKDVDKKKTIWKKKDVEKKKAIVEKKVIDKKKAITEKKVVEKKKTIEKKKVVTKKKTIEKKKVVVKKKTTGKKKIVAKKKTTGKKRVVTKKKTKATKKRK